MLAIEDAITLAWFGRTVEAANTNAPVESAWREELSASRARLLAQYYAAMGDATGAAPYVRRGIDTYAFFTRKTIPLDPWWDKIRGAPEFEAALKDAGAKK